jgi:hypothetical protein
VSFYSGLQSTAAALIAGKGQPITLTSRTPGAYDPATGTAAITVTTEVTAGVVLDFSSKDIDGTLIKVGDKRVILKATTILPTTTSTLTIGGVVHTIVDAYPVNPGGTLLIYKIQVRI